MYEEENLEDLEMINKVMDIIDNRVMDIINRNKLSDSKKFINEFRLAHEELGYVISDLSFKLGLKERDE